MPHPSSRPPPASSRDAAFALAAGFLGWTLDAFDFFLVVVSIPQIATDFQTPEASIAFSLTLTLAFRPVGAFLFGLMADRYGRRIPLMIDLVFYSAVEVATGLAPNLGTFLVLRALFGIGMGGEWGVGASLVMEKVPPRWRGVLSGLLQEGYAAGYLLAAVAAYFMRPHFGWRALFFVGGAPALLALFVRLMVRESEVWQKSKAESWSQLGRGLAGHWKLWIYLTLLMAMMNFASHGTQDLYPTFMKSYRGLANYQVDRIVIIMMVGALIGGVLFGLASDRLGRRRMMVVAFVCALLAVPLWALSERLPAIIAGGFLMQFVVQGAWGIVPAHINELAPNQVRGFLPGFAYQCGNLIASSIDSAQALLAERYPYPDVMAVSAAVIFALAMAVITLGSERRGVVFGEDAAKN